MNDQALKSTKEQKHLLIDNHIYELENEISRLVNLVDKIEGSELAKSEEKDRPTMSLMEFLDNTPGRLSELTKILDDCRQKLQEYLF